MEANLLLGASTLVLGIGASSLALVLYRKSGNGHSKEVAEHYTAAEQAAEQPLKDVPDWQLARDMALKDLVDRLDYLPVRMEQAFRHSLEEQSKEPGIPPEWAARMLGDLDQINEHSLAVEKMNANLVRFTEVVEAVLQMPAAPPQPVPGTYELIHQIEALVEAERKRASNPTRPPMVLASFAQPPDRIHHGEPPDRIHRESVPPPTRAANPVNLEEFNTVAIPQDTIVELIPPEVDVFTVNVMNLGPGTVFLRKNAEPIIDDPHATRLPPSTGDNGISTPERLYVIADVGGADIIVRVIFG